MISHKCDQSYNFCLGGFFSFSRLTLVQLLNFSGGCSHKLEIDLPRFLACSSIFVIVMAIDASNSRRDLFFMFC